MEQIGGLQMTEKVARKLVYVPEYASNAFQDATFCEILCEKDWSGVISAESMRRAVNSDEFLYDSVLFGLLAGVFPGEYAELTPTEQEEYRAAVARAEEQCWPWRHPSFVSYASADKEFLQWIQESKQLPSYKDNQ
jgi:hypothetical protein